MACRYRSARECGNTPGFVNAMTSNKTSAALSDLGTLTDSQIEFESVYLGRQPILGRDGALAAFELLFRSSLENRALITNDQEATAHVLVRTIGDVGIAAALGSHMGYLNISRDMLMSEVVLLIPPQRFVLEILETVVLDAAAIERCAKLRQYGFKIALDDVTVLSDRLRTAIPVADIIKIDLLDCERNALLELVSLAKAHNKTLLAEKVETAADHQLALRLGFDFFQGYYFAKPQVLVSRRASSSKQGLLRLLGLLATEPTLGQLESELKLSPNLVVQVLRLINSSAFGFSRPISSLRQAIIAIGTRQITRWAQLLFFAEGSNVALQSDPLVQLAGARARFMEVAAEAISRADEKLADAAFMTGIFSLVHVVFGSTTEEIVDTLRLSPSIRNAILEESGELGLLLALAKAVEKGDELAIGKCCERLGAEYPTQSHQLDAAQVGEMALASAAWISAHARI